MVCVAGRHDGFHDIDSIKGSLEACDGLIVLRAQIALSSDGKLNDDVGVLGARYDEMSEGIFSALDSRTQGQIAMVPLGAFQW